VRSARGFLSGVLVVLLAGSAGVGCGASNGANSRASNRPLTSPAQLAGEIDRAQAVIDNQSGSALGLQRAAVSQQLAFRQLADHRPLRRPTLARLTPGARSAAKAALRASGALSGIVPAEHRFPDWRIIAPPPPDQLLSYYRARLRPTGSPGSTSRQSSWSRLATRTCSNSKARSPCSPRAHSSTASRRPNYPPQFQELGVTQVVATCPTRRSTRPAYRRLSRRRSPLTSTRLMGAGRAFAVRSSVGQSSPPLGPPAVGAPGSRGLRPRARARAPPEPCQGSRWPNSDQSR
jgi:hypothetical protein